VAIETLIAAPPWESLPVLRYGGGGDRTHMVCGYQSSIQSWRSSLLFHRLSCLG
jgi:hypothetical protein